MRNDVTLKYLEYDIETLVPEDGTFPTSNKDQIIIVSLAFEPEFHDRSTMVLSTKTNCKNEKELLETFLQIVDEYDPDILSSYNGNEFDNQYISDRMMYVGVTNTISRAGRGWYGRFNRDKTTWVCPGRIVLDLLPLVKKHLNQTEYKNLKIPLREHSLRYVAKNFLKIEKLDMKSSEMRRIWLSDDYIKMIEYAERDAVVVGELRREMQILDKYIALSKASGALLQDVLNGGQSTMIDNLMLRAFKDIDRAIPMRAAYDEGPVTEEEEVRYAGATVLDPVVGMHTNIIIMDFASLYPSIMRAFNLSPDTIYYEGKVAKFRMDFPGIVPQILEKLYNERVEYKKKMKATKSKDEKNLYNLKQYGNKILLNSIYGYFGFSKARLFEVSIAAKVTEEGRKALLLTKETVENHGKCLVIAGDTDSVMFTIPECDTFEKAKIFATSLHDEMSKKLPAPMSLAFESFGKRGVFLAKKRYAIAITEDGKEYNIKYRGIEVRRRDWCEYVGETLTRIFDILLKDGDIQKAGKYAKDQIDRVANLINVSDDQDLMSKLVLSKKYTKPIEQYKTKTMHMEALKRAKKRGESDYLLGDRISFYVVAGRKKAKISALTEVVEYVLENNKPINKEYYIGKQLKPPINRIFNVLKFDIVRQRYETSQMLLCDLM
jgi:DNA polymerase I